MGVRHLSVVFAVMVVAAGCSGGHSSAGHATTGAGSGVPSRPASHVATEQGFEDLALLRAWLAPTIAQSAQRPRLVRAEIVHSTPGRFDAMERPTEPPIHDATPVYVVQLTGSTFVCPCNSPKSQTGSALRVAWNPTIHFVSAVEAGAPFNLARVGRVYELQVGRPAQTAPSGPQCGQPRGRATTIIKVERLAHRVDELPEVFTPPGHVTPLVSAIDALRTADMGYLAPNVKATLAIMTGPPNAIVPGSRLVWVFSAPSVEVTPTIGYASCGAAAAVVDATSRRSLVEYEGRAAF